MQKCPGQDMRFWKPDDLFDIPCPVCGTRNEFFKDDVMRRCSECGHTFKNPRLDMGCAEWCEFADQCLPKLKSLEALENAGATLREQLIRAVSREMADDRNALARSIAVLDKARELMRDADADTRIVVAAGALAVSAEKWTAGHIPHRTRRVLGDLGFDDNTVNAVSDVLEALRLGSTHGTPEYHVVKRALMETGSPG